MSIAPLVATGSQNLILIPTDRVMSRFSSFKPFLIGLGILAVGVIGFIILVSLRPEPPREERTVLAPVVQVAPAMEASGPLTVTGTGSVQSDRQVALSAEVGGRIDWVSPRFVNGGSFKAGETLAQIDTTDYANAVAMARAEWTARTVDALMAREESSVARREWERLQAREANLEAPESGELGVMLFREPQVRMADAAVEAAKARLDDALARLDRTNIRAPFDGQITSKQAELGQVVAPGLVLAAFHSTAAGEVAVPLRPSQADLLDNVHSLNGSRSLPALLGPASGDGPSWEARIVRSEGTLDPATRTLRVVARVARPLSQDPPLLFGSFVSVHIEGRSLDGAVEIPREALRDGDLVCVMEEGALSIREVDVLAEEEGRVFLTSGVSNGESVVVSSLSVVTQGMNVRVAE